MLHNDTTDPADIEADLARERNTLADNLGQLRNRLTADALMAEAKSLAVGNLAPLTRGLDRTVRANPLAVALIGAGVAWLAFGRRGKTDDPCAAVLAGTKYEALSRWEDEGGPPQPLPEPDDSLWMDETDRLHSGALDALARIAAAAKDRMGSAAQIAADTAAERGAVVAGFAADARAALRRGLEALPAATQDQIANLREKAYLAHRATVQRTVNRTGRLIEDDPLVAGLIALALGSGLAAALPRTETEDRLLGAERDRLIGHAKAVLREERQRALEMAAGLAGTLRQDLHDAVR